MSQSNNKPFLQPGKLLLIDGIGACITASSLLGLLRPFPEHFGMPPETATWLAVIALLYGTYSLLCYFLLKKNWSFWLRIIAMANLLYCICTLALVIFNFSEMTILGMVYFLGEILIISGLAYTEWRATLNPSITEQ